MLETPTVQMSPSKQRRPEIAPALSLAGPEPVGNSAPGVFRQNLGGRYANKAVEGQADSPADCDPQSNEGSAAAGLLSKVTQNQ